jgi:5'-nucleotidase (lipoprotein e(P4) family)
MKNSTIFLALIVLFSTACKRVEVKNKQQINDNKMVANSDYLLAATAYHQLSAEYQALCIQSFNIARRNIDDVLNQEKGIKPPCIIVDIDETMLDNSPFEVECIRQQKSYSSESWKQWCDMAKARAIPGALEFAKYAEQNEIDVIYCSNRKIAELDATMKNMSDLGFPFISKDHFLLKDSVSTKRYRRAKVQDKYHIVMLIGDNLNDFDELFENRANDFGKGNVDDRFNQFGSKFIVLPNPIYGNWVDAIENSSMEQGDLSRVEKLKSKLIGY